MRRTAHCVRSLAAVLALTWGGVAQADVIRVPEDVGTIQAAIDLTAPGDVVLVAPGLYPETLRFPSGRPITVRSSHGAAVTTVDSVQNYVLFMEGQMGPDSVLQGFTLIGHSNISRSLGLSCTPTLRDCAWTQTFHVYLDLANPTFVNCKFTDGGSSGQIDVFSSVPEFINCTFANNDRSFLVWTVGTSNPGPQLRNCILLGVDQIHEGGDGTPFASLQHCLIEPTTCVGLACDDPTNVVTSAPLLDAQSRPLPGSPAIDMGSNAWLPAWVGADWAGAPRFAYGLPLCELEPVVDAGAYELQTNVCHGTALPYCATSPNSVDPVGAHIGYVGSLFVSDGDLTLTAAPVPDSLGMFFFGVGTNFEPMGDGTLCISGPAYRLAPMQVPPSTHLAERVLDFGEPTSNASRLLGGSTWYFQYWYRDVTPPGVGFNFSDGLLVHFGD